MLKGAGPTQTFTNPTACGSTSYTVPVGAVALKVTATGAAGAAGNTQGHAVDGGRGSAVTTTIPATPGTVVYIQVGGNGNGTSGGGWRRGGRPTSSKDLGTGGGAASGIAATTAGCGNWLVVAGGGGGGGGGGTTNSYNINGERSGHGGDGGARGIADERPDEGGWDRLDSCSGLPGSSQAAPPDYQGPRNIGGKAQTLKGRSGVAGADGDEMSGGQGGNGLTGGGPGGGGGFWGGGGASGAPGCNGAGGAGGASYVIDTSSWLIAANTTY